MAENCNLFVDTNIFLHYKSFEDINWLSIAQTNTVTIIIPPVIIRELNKHKEIHPQSHIRSRANRTLKKMSELLKTSSSPKIQIRPNFYLFFEYRDPVIDLATFQLNPDIQDDQLLASILLFKDDNPGANILLITGDVGLTLITKSRRFGINTCQLPDDLKLPPESDSKDKRIQELEQELKNLKCYTPILSLGFEGEKNNVTFKIDPQLEMDPQKINNIILDIKLKQPKMQTGVNMQLPSVMPYSIMADTLKDFTIPDKDIIEYNSALDAYYKEYEKYISASVNYLNRKNLTLKLVFIVSNKGSAPADDIDVIIRFPSGLRIMDEDDCPEPPEEPIPPDKPKTSIQKTMELITSIPNYNSIPWNTMTPKITPVNVSTFRINPVTHEVTFHINRVKQNMPETSQPLYIEMSEYSSATSFNIEYRIIAANLPKEVLSNLHIIVSKE